MTRVERFALAASFTAPGSVLSRSAVANRTVYVSSRSRLAAAYSAASHALEKRVAVVIPDHRVLVTLWAPTIRTAAVCGSESARRAERCSRPRRARWSAAGKERPPCELWLRTEFAVCEKVIPKQHRRVPPTSAWPAAPGVTPPPRSSTPSVKSPNIGSSRSGWYSSIKRAANHPRARIGVQLRRTPGCPTGYRSRTRSRPSPARYPDSSPDNAAPQPAARNHQRRAG